MIGNFVAVVELLLKIEIHAHTHTGVCTMSHDTQFKIKNLQDQVGEKPVEPYNRDVNYPIIDISLIKMGLSFLYNTNFDVIYVWHTCLT